MIQVSTLDDLILAVASNTSKIVVISGEITGNAVVYIGSNTSVLGKTGASKFRLGSELAAMSLIPFSQALLVSGFEFLKDAT